MWRRFSSIPPLTCDAANFHRRFIAKRSSRSVNGERREGRPRDRVDIICILVMIPRFAFWKSNERFLEKPVLRHYSPTARARAPRPENDTIKKIDELDLKKNSTMPSEASKVKFVFVQEAGTGVYQDWKNQRNVCRKRDCTECFRVNPPHQKLHLKQIGFILIT